MLLDNGNCNSHACGSHCLFCLPRKQLESEEVPPGYIQTLVKKITNNLSVVCNNLILKYVEDDIVLSINVRTVSSCSADHNWAPAFTGE